MQLYPGRLTQKIGYETIRGEAKTHARSEMGKERLEKMSPHSDEARIRRKLQATREMMDLQRNDAAFPLHQLPDIRGPLDRSGAEGSMLPLEQFQEIRLLAATARRVKRFLSDREDRYPRLDEISTGLIPLPELEDAIDEVVDEGGGVRNDASPGLKKIRKQLGKKRNELRNTIDKVLNRARKDGYASDEGPTLRNGRMVIPIQAKHKRKIQGFVQDVSSSGQTVYLEPVEALEINNEIRQLESEEKSEVERIIRELTGRVREQRDYLRQNVDVLGRFDETAAKAALSIKLDGFIPSLSKDRYFRLVEAYNPILLLKNLSLPESKREPVIPLNMEMEKEERCLIITGPNAGGKSVAMKTLALCAMMSQSGFAIPAKESTELPVFSGLFVDMGDDQSIENDLSTFSSRLEWMKKTLRQADGRSLILIDEAGAGTDPDEGGALFQSLIERLVDDGATILVTTHHGSLKVFAHEHPKAVNGSMEFDQDTLSPTYRFKKGIPGSSYAFEIAERMELNVEVLEEAKRILGKSKENLESLISDLESRAQEARELKKEYEELKDQMVSEKSKYRDKRETLERKQDAIREKALRQASEIMESANRRIEEAVEKIVEQGKKDDKAIQEARDHVEEQKQQVGEELEEIESRKKQRKKDEISEDPPEVGDTVRLIDANTNGELVEIQGNNAIVQSGGLRLRTKYNNLVKVEDRKEKENRENRVSVNISSEELRKPVKPTLEIRGMRGPEAVRELTHYLDHALARGLQQVEIIHGKGEGILKRLVHEHLEERSDVKDYRLAPADRGGAGCTIVEL